MVDLHRTTGRWRLGVGLALVTSTIWGLLALALKVLVTTMDPFTVTWCRFLGAGRLMLVAGRHGPRPSPRRAPALDECRSLTTRDRAPRSCPATSAWTAMAGSDPSGLACILAG
jgi:drug/metabolite transporter (DMT)-like permease